MNTTKKRIGIDARMLQEAYSSGIPEYAYYVIKNIILNNPDYTFVLFFNSFRNVSNIIPKDILEISEYKIFRIPNKILEWTWRFFPYPKIDTILKVDYFFSPHFYFIPLSKKVKKVLTIHDLSFEKDKRYFSFRKNLWHLQMNPKVMAKKADKIIAVSRATKNDLIDIYNIDENKIVVIPNAYDFDTKSKDTHNNDLDTLRKWSLETNEYILFLGTIEPRKNVSMVIDSYLKSKLINKKLVIAGKKGWLYKKALSVLKEKHPDIVFTDYITNREKEALFRNCYLFLFPALYEGFGVPVIEASSFGKSVVTSSVSSIPEIINQGALFINPHVTSYYTKALDLLIDTDNIKSLTPDTTKQDFIQWKEVAQKTLESIVL
ncbi:MAG: glycosyltransferase family 1 protein [Patescibacteria group bacterium]